jgi:hypothetical protein
MSTAAIVSAIFEHAEDMAIGSPVLPVFFEGIAVKPPVRTKYLWVSLAPNETERLAIGFDGVRVHQGIILINLFWINGAGLVEPYEAADQVRAHWVDGTRLEGGGTRVEINRPPSVRSAVQEGAKMFIPIVVEYRSTTLPAVWNDPAIWNE